MFRICEFYKHPGLSFISILKYFIVPDSFVTLVGVINKQGNSRRSSEEKA